MNRFIACVLLLCLTVIPAFASEEIQLKLVKYASSKSVPDTEALRFTRGMGAGWNLGNTFDATNDNYRGSDLNIETSWGNPKTTLDMIKALKDAGFSTLRLPVSWHNHVNKDFVINTPWLNRVQEVVDMAIGLDMYVILNTHHDVYPEYYYPSSEYAETSLRYITKIWEQVAERFKDYDHHLIFEGMNEPRLKDNADYEWSYNPNSPECKDAGECLKNLNQAFVDAVRNGGGFNTDRYLMVTPYCASPSFLDYFELPKDTVENRLIVSIHAYTPYDFALNEAGTDKFTINQTSEILMFMNNLYNRYIANGIPVVIGEFGARNKNGNLQDRVEFTAFYVATATGRGIPCCWWDNGLFTGTKNDELFGIYNRRTCTWTFPEIRDALVNYAIK